MLRAARLTTLALLTLASGGFAVAQTPATIDFTNVSGGSSIGIDVDNNGSDDVVIAGTTGQNLSVQDLGLTQVFSSGKGLTFTEGNGPELTLTFPNGLGDNLSFAFATSWGCGNATGVQHPNLTLTASAFSAGNNAPLGTSTATAECQSPSRSSDFAEGQVSLTNIAGADRVEINFNDNSPEPNVIIDNITASYTATVSPTANTVHKVPTLPLPVLGLLIAAVALFGRKLSRGI